jgi:hypothetical protein
VLTEMSGQVEDEDEDRLLLSELLQRLNARRGRSDKVSRAELEQVLIELEKENKLMYVQDSDEPFLMLV